MPLPLPYFNNQIDPTLPKSVVAEHYRYDEYGTYDVIKAERIGIYVNLPPNFVCTKINNEIVILLDNFVPWSYAWAEEYSYKTYIFLKNFTGTDYYGGFLSGKGISGLDFDFGSESQIVNLSSYDVLSQEQIILPATTSPVLISLTWFQRENTSENNEFIKKYYSLVTSEKPSIIKLTFGELLYCSVVIDSSSLVIKQALEQQLNEKSRGYLYSNLDELFQDVTKQIESNFPRLYKLLRSLNYEIKQPLITGVSPVFKPETNIYHHITVNASYGFTTRWNDASFIDRPSYYRACSIFYAYNNYWNNGIVKSNEGYTSWFYPESPNFSVFKPEFLEINTYNFCYKTVQIAHQASVDIRDSPYPKVDFYYQLYFPLDLNKKNYQPPSCLPGIGLNKTDSPDTLVGNTVFRGDHSVQVIVDAAPGGFINRDLDNKTIASCPTIPQPFDGLMYATSGKKYISAWVSLEGYFLDETNAQSLYNVKYTRRYVELESVAEAYNYDSTTPYKVNEDNESILYNGSAKYIFDYKEEIVKTGVVNFYYYNNYNQLANSPASQQSYYLASINNIQYNDLNYYDSSNDMPDSVRVKEIHEALNAKQFASDTNGENVVANLGYYIERIARVLGISVNPDGTIRSIRQKKNVLASSPLPDGWNFGQWGLNQGGHPPNSNAQEGGKPDEYRDGIIYEQRCNIKRKNAFGDPIITSGDYTLCENIPQLLDEILDDLDKGLGWQELGANFIPNADNSGKYISYEGLAQLQTEVAYMLSRISQHTSQTQVATLIIQAVAYELLRATGQPILPKAFQADVGGEDLVNVPYPGLAPDAPTQLQQTGWLLQTIAPILGALLKPKAEEE